MSGFGRMVRAERGCGVDSAFSRGFVAGYPNDQTGCVKAPGAAAGAVPNVNADL